MSAPLLRLEGVTCRYGREPVLEGADLAVAAGEMLGIVGPSGSGKTTLLRALAGRLRPTAGRVVRDGGVRIAYVPQVETIDWSFPVTVAECVLMARPARPLRPWPTARERLDVAALLERLGLGGLERRHIRELSGGQQQRVFVARALIARPDALLLDEPTSGVDLRVRHDLLHLLGELHRQGIAIVLTTHDLNGVAAHLPRIVCLNRTIVADGEPHAVLRADVLERTYGAPLEVLQHAGLPVVVDAHGPRHAHARQDGHLHAHVRDVA